MVEPTEILARLQAARKAFEQRDFELAITNCDYIIANAEGSSEEAKEAKELRRHASEHELLGKIAEASEFELAIPLIEQAIQKKKLRYDLDGKPLKTALDTWVSQRSAAADAQARTLLEEGQRLEDQKEYAAAQTSYQGAAGIAFTSEVIQQNAGAGLKRVQDILSRWQDYQDLVKQAGELQARGDFLEAQTAASQAVRSFPENPGEAEKLVRQLEEQVKEAERMGGLLDGAEKELGGKNFDQAAASFGTALEIARRLNLPERAQEIESRLAEALRQKQELSKQVKDLAQKARTAVEQGKLAEASSLLGELRELDPFNPELAEVQALMQRREDVLEAVKEIKIQAATSKSPREQLRLYEAALGLLPDDPELLELKKQADRALILEAMLATAAELDLGFDTPSELEQGKLAPDGRVKVKGIQQWIEEYGAAAASELVTLSHQVFGRIAAQKLREFIATRAGEKQRKGEFDEAIGIYSQALQEWDVEWLKSTTVEWQSIDGQSLKSTMARKALESRLEIVKTQGQLVIKTQENYPPVGGFKQSGDAAQAQHHYDAARQNYENALKEIIALDAGQQAVLAGVRAELTRSLSRVLRLTAQELSADIQTQRRQTEQHRDLNELETALRKAGEAKNNAQKLRELFQRFQEITPKEQQAAWAASDQSTEIEALYAQVESYRRYYQAFKQGDEALEDGEYGAAEQYYKLVEQGSPWGAEARGRLDKLPVLQQLRADYENAKDRKDYQAALDTLGKVISQDGHSTWVAAERVHLAPLAEKQRRAALLVSLAEEAIQARNYPLAVGQLEEALQDFPGYKAAESLLATARQKLVESEQIAKARKLMVDEYTRGAARTDYESALARAKQVLLDNPADETAKRVSKTSQEIIDLSREIEDKEALRDYAGAQALLEAKSYLSGDYISNLQFRISQKLEEKSKFEDLLAQAKAASEQKDWGTALGKASLAAQKSSSSVEPRNLATQARNHLVQLIREKVDPRTPVTAEALGAAENAVAAIRMAQGEEALNEILGDLVYPLNRARAIIKASNHLTSNEPGAAYEALKPFEGQRSTDAELGDILREAEFAAKRKQALDILGSRPIDYAKAAELLYEARLINSQDMEVNARYKEARLEAGLLACNDALRRGQPTHIARQHLLGLPSTEKRVADMQTVLEALDRTMGEAQGFFNNIQHEKAIQALDEALKVWPGYVPAEEQRKAILEDALDRAGKAEVAENYELARRYYQLGREYGFEETRKRGVDGVQAIDERLETMFRKTWLDVTAALEDPDLTETRRAELQSEFSQLAVRNADRQDRVEIIDSCVDELKVRSELIRQVEKHLDDAEKELDSALSAPTYEIASDRFYTVEKILEKATGVEHYSMRTRTKNLRLAVTEHIRKRKEASAAYTRLTTDISNLYHPLDKQLSADAATPDEVEAVRTAGESLLDTALQANRRAKELDPLNKYLVRPWQTQGDPQSDPLVQQETHLLKQQAELKKLSNAMITALGKRTQAGEQDRKAQDLYGKAADDDTIKEAITTWGKAVKNYQEAHQLLEHAAVELPPNSIPHLQGLRSLCAFLIKSSEDAADDVTRRSQEVVKLLDEIIWKRRSAIQAFDEREQDRKARVTALDLYQEILELNPRDSESLSRTRVLRKEIQGIKNGRRNLMMGGGVALIVLVLALVAFAIFRPGGVGNPYTPTPTASPTGTRTPTLTATITLTPTVTPSPVLPPTRTPTATLGPTLTPTQWICRVNGLTYAYTEPTTSISAYTRFDTGQSVLVTDIVPPEITADNMRWLEILYFDTRVNSDVVLYIHAISVPVECWSTTP